LKLSRVAAAEILGKKGCEVGTLSLRPSLFFFSSSCFFISRWKKAQKKAAFLQLSHFWCCKNNFYFAFD
jgi:hypothetical protein